ncbi:hypothetical protein [Aeromonas hydrophila]|uniref:hypothetical protein n=1 Tax=Aeromonas hydrophila TaxID=644 RepID=UPI000332B54D|nr:hypothetical protein [Aeromonas hydrophila]AGM44171.1 hypothetical protein AHML_11955 [Aeromonas hydrophila ML09-119]AHX32844.1 hypothetical protein V428_12340 [Aeromonas hydrophila subsp. hydrophila AL09-71]AHX69642.1 hypothetical protein V429_12355 [Aeromonas hydrophila pc104A]AJE38617.1 hypothetical protein V469_10720 [Aeromonas hydrophila J-1]AKJ37045.1 hypothetical protein U876_11130 [Aeromonas hydrophila NJ-35]
MTPIYDTAVIGKNGKTKFYDSARVIEIFNLIHQPANNAFYGNLKKPVCTDEHIDAATAAYEQAIEWEKQRDVNRQMYLDEQDLLQSYRESLIGNRDCLVNTNTNKVFLLPDNHGLFGRYHNLISVMTLPSDYADFITSQSTSEFDCFVLEPVMQVTVSRLLEPEDK